MSVDVHWLEGQYRILHFRYQNAWTWDDYYDALNHADTLVQESGQPVRVIHDFRESGAFPASRPNHIAQYACALLENKVHHVVIGGGELWAALRALLVRDRPALNGILISAATLDEALEAMQDR